MSSEPIFFDPNTIDLIPQSKLEQYILNKRYDPICTNSLVHHDEHLSLPTPVSTPVTANDDSISNSMAEKAGLIIPATSP